MIEVKQINKTFGKLKALNSIDMLFKTNISYAVIGPNGAGKTTLIKSILGLVVPDSGYITVDNINIILNEYFLSNNNILTSPAASIALPDKATTLCLIILSIPAIPIAEIKLPIVVGAKQTNRAINTVIVIT